MLINQSRVIGFTLITSLCSLVVYYYWQLNSKKNKKVFVKELWIYPIKSCKGILVNEAKITKRGFRHDRMFMIVDSNGRFISQRKYPIMALIETSIVNVDNKEVLIVKYKEKELSIQIEYKSSANPINVNVWGDECQAYEILYATEWFREVMDTPDVRFVCMDDNSIRRTNPEYAPDGQTGFADGFPFLLLSQESINHLNRNLKNVTVTAKNFRPNIVVSGSTPFAEDSWKDIKFVSNDHPPSEISMKVVKPCSRCQIPNINPETGSFYDDNEPSRTMKSYRTGEAIGLSKSKWKSKLFFGQNLDHSGLDNGIIRIDDKLIIVSTN